MYNKCDFCAQEFFNTYEEINFNCSGITSEYECSCSENSIEIYQEYLEDTFKFINDESFCDNNNYCCNNPDKHVSFTLKLLGDSTTLFEKSYTWVASLEESYDNRETISSFDLESFTNFKFKLNTNEDNNMNIGLTYKINDELSIPMSMEHLSSKSMSEMIKNEKIVLTLSEAGDNKNIFKDLFGNSKELKITINDK